MTSELHTTDEKPTAGPSPFGILTWKNTKSPAKETIAESRVRMEKEYERNDKHPGATSQGRERKQGPQ